MSTDNPFSGDGDGDKTVFMPTPGGRRREARRPPPTPGRSPAQAPQPTPVPAAPPPPIPEGGGQAVVLRGSGLNPLVDAATAILALVGQLRGTPTHPDVAGLRNRVVREIQAFEHAARARVTSPESLLAARYALCTLVDETVLSTPWGSESIWSKQSILSTFHNEVWGGEKVFQILDRMAQEPARHIDLLELLYICLAMGFEGKYRVLERGRAQLESIQDNLFRTIRMQRGDFERDLSPHWQGVVDRRNALVRYVPLWVVGALAGALLLALYVGFTFSLSNTSDPVFAELQGIGRDTRPLLEREVPPAEPAPRTVSLSEFLEPEVEEGLVTVTESGNRTAIRIRGDGLFRSGSAQLSADRLPLMRRLAEALSTVSGQVQVVGHTDSVPIRTLRFPSNWHLSEARAQTVLKTLAQDIDDPSRLKAEGRADTEPLMPNDTPEHRALNRRVELILSRGGDMRGESGQNPPRAGRGGEGGLR